MSYDRITTGYWVISRLDGGPKTYACASEKGLHDLIVHLTGREPSTFPLRDGLPGNYHHNWTTHLLVRYLR